MNPPFPPIFQIGHRVHSELYGGRDGIIFAIHGEQRPNSIQHIGGVIVSGGNAELDIVFSTGTISRMIPEGIVRGVQWRFIDRPIATSQEIADALAFADAETLRRKSEAEAQAHAREKLRAELLATHTPFLTPSVSGKPANASKNLKRELSRAFPGTKFSVRCDSGDAINVHWTSGPTVDQVESIAKKYQQGHFNGMEDIYEYDPDNVWSEVFGGSRYVFTRRDFPDTLRESAARAICAAQNLAYAGPNTPNIMGEGDSDCLSDYVHRALHDTDFSTGADIAGAEYGRTPGASRPFGFRILFQKTTENAERVPQTNTDETMNRFDPLGCTAHTIAPPAPPKRRAKAPPAPKSNFSPAEPSNPILAITVATFGALLNTSSKTLATSTRAEFAAWHQVHTPGEDWRASWKKFLRDSVKLPASNVVPMPPQPASDSRITSARNFLASL